MKLLTSRKESSTFYEKIAPHNVMIDEHSDKRGIDLNILLSLSQVLYGVLIPFISISGSIKGGR